ncbi:Uncharacterized [Moorella glycerini]|uniref:Uncharacterized protein n=1 Tax=Neomoorella stamsii TaxID=1266720 RepID=A0A9X7P4T3_9FIRM|nr:MULTISPECIES: hypothetical protein [Moorella]PRR68980.1 hypothetical protein MOST_32620 [Moorella stamsii]CEP67601.1 Uncharacterized [Moorella glycerini]
MKKVQGIAASVLAVGMLLASPVWAAENRRPLFKQWASVAEYGR